MGPLRVFLIAIRRRLFVAGAFLAVVTMVGACSTFPDQRPMPDLTGTWVSTEGVEIYGHFAERDGFDTNSSEVFEVTYQEGPVFRATITFIHDSSVVSGDSSAQSEEVEAVELMVIGLVDHNHRTFRGGNAHNLHIYGQVLDANTIQISMFASGAAWSAGRHTLVREGS